MVDQIKLAEEYLSKLDPSNVKFVDIKIDKETFLYIRNHFCQLGNGENALYLTSNGDWEKAFYPFEDTKEMAATFKLFKAEEW